VVGARSSVAKVEREAYGVHLSFLHRQTGRAPASSESSYRCRRFMTVTELAPDIVMSRNGFHVGV